MQHSFRLNLIKTAPILRILSSLKNNGMFVIYGAHFKPLYWMRLLGRRVRVISLLLHSVTLSVHSNNDLAKKSYKLTDLSCEAGMSIWRQNLFKKKGMCKLAFHEKEENVPELSLKPMGIQQLRLWSNQ